MEPSSRIKAKELINQGYYQVSRKWRMLARLPKGKSGKDALIEASGRSDWKLDERACGDHFLRCYCKDTLIVEHRIFKAFRELGGTTYF